MRIAPTGERICHSKELYELKEQLNIQFRYCHYHGVCRKAPTGEDYITFTFRPVSTKKAAITAFNHIIEEYCKDKNRTHTIYWRQFPELRTQSGKYKVWSRLLISNLPIETGLVRGINEQNH